MRFVNNHDLLFQLPGQILDLLPQVANIVDPAIGRRVHFRDIHRRLFQNGAAVFAFVAGIPVLRLQAVHRAGQYFGTRRLTGAPRAVKQIRVPYGVGLHLIFQYVNDIVLSDHLVKGIRPKRTIQSLHKTLHKTNYTIGKSHF